MDLKAPGNLLYLVGETRDEFGGSHYSKLTGKSQQYPPCVNLERAPKLFRALHAAIQEGLVRACHDISEGGLAVAVAEMAFAGEIGVDIAREPAAPAREDVFLFSESPTRWLVEVDPKHAAAIKNLFNELPLQQIGKTTPRPMLRIGTSITTPLSELKAAWQSLSHAPR
jgi:phosphoribosylformylglycinamidine synthase